MRIDSHIHLDDLDPVVLGSARAPADPAWHALVPGITPSRTIEALRRVAADPRVVVGAGWHPWHLPAGRSIEEGLDALAAVVAMPGVAAVGEIGLDRVRVKPDDASGVERERAWFEAQLDLARSRDLPVVVHAVRAWEETLRSLTRVGPGQRGIMHGWSGSLEMAHAVVRAGFVVGLGPVLTDPRARRARRTAAELPRGTWVLETDAPWMWPRDGRAGRGSPDDLDVVEMTVATLREQSVEDVRRDACTTFLQVVPVAAWSGADERRGPHSSGVGSSSRVDDASSSTS